MFAEYVVVAGVVAIAIVAAYMFSKNAYVWRSRQTSKLDKELDGEIHAWSQFDVDFAVNVCFTDWLDLYRDHSRVDRLHQVTKKPLFFVHVLPMLIEDERLRKIYVRFAGRYQLIGNDRKASYCWSVANNLNTQISLTCGYAVHDGIPCDRLLQQLRN